MAMNAFLEKKFIRRFMLRMSKDRTPVKDVTGEPLYFPTKAQAKTYRDNALEDMTISVGPDHRKW